MKSEEGRREQARLIGETLKKAENDAAGGEIYFTVDLYSFGWNVPIDVFPFMMEVLRTIESGQTQCGPCGAEFSKVPARGWAVCMIGKNPDNALAIGLCATCFEKGEKFVARAYAEALHITNLTIRRVGEPPERSQ